MAHKTALRPAPLPSSTTRCAPCLSVVAARTEPQVRFRATKQAPDIHRRTDASARCECPLTVQAPSCSRCRHRTAALARVRRSAAEPAPAPQCDRPRRASQDAPPFAAQHDGRHERCAPGTNSGEPSRPSCESYGAGTCAIKTTSEAKENTQGRHYTLKSLLGA